MRKTLGCFLLLVFSIQCAVAQQKPAITDSDVISMAKAGIGENTIILTIEQGPTQFDTSPTALIELKNAGVSDPVLNAMLAAAKGQASASELDAKREAGERLFRKVLDAMGSSEAIGAVKAVRFTSSRVRTHGTATTTLSREYTKRYPDAVSNRFTSSNGQEIRDVITPQFGYRSSGTKVTATDSEVVAEFRRQILFDSIYIAQHPSDYEAELVQGGPPTGVQWLKISRMGTSVVWTISGQSNMLISTTLPGRPEGEKIEYSDYRRVSNVMIPYKRRSVGQSETDEDNIDEFEINPTLDSALFDRPTATPAQTPSTTPAEGLRIKVLQAESVPYVQETGGGISTSCSIVGNSSTSGRASTFGNTTFGDSTTSSDMHMRCNSYDRTIRWPHVLNTMLVIASDGNAYLIACDAAWRWSKCVSLRSGEIFNARMTDKGIEVDSFNSKGKESNPAYRIIQSRSLK